MELSTLSDIASSPSVAALLGRTLDYNFPIFDFSEACDGLPLLVLSHHLCVSSGLLSRLSLDPQLFVNCMASIERGYHAELPFHNSLHAADVLHCINYLVSKAPVRSIFSDLELLAVYVAAAVHDFDHPGVGNGFLVASADRKALLYNDKSVLENHHCAAAFEVMSRQQCSFLSKLDRADYKIVREAVIEMVLATDLSQHFSLLTMFKKKVLAAEKFDPVATREDRILLMQMLMKCSDVSNPTKAWPQYSRWIDRITQEWYLQGDREKALGLPVSPFMNRDSQSATNPASAQSGFINFIVAPLFDAFGSWADVTEIKKALDLNRGRWEAALLGQQQLQQIRRELAMQSDRRPSLPSPNASGPASDSSGYTPMRVPRRRNKSLSFIAELAEMPESEYHGTASSSLPSLSSVSTSVTTVLVDDSTGTQTRGLPTKTLMDRRKSGPVPFPTVSEEREDA
ncbi:hypothetical protein DFJ73DRAFT_630142 [Zopfochytrium polystomum]|nr:hypothetical protein DFJ73DRAFT_630142 [Zopfochytrium polystomum]